MAISREAVRFGIVPGLADLSGKLFELAKRKRDKESELARIKLQLSLRNTAGAGRGAGAQQKADKDQLKAVQKVPQAKFKTITEKQDFDEASEGSEIPSVTRLQSPESARKAFDATSFATPETEVPPDMQDTSPRAIFSEPPETRATAGGQGSLLQENPDIGQFSQSFQQNQDPLRLGFANIAAISEDERSLQVSPNTAALSAEVLNLASSGAFSAEDIPAISEALREDAASESIGIPSNTAQPLVAAAMQKQAQLQQNALPTNTRIQLLSGNARPVGETEANFGVRFFMSSGIDRGTAEAAIAQSIAEGGNTFTAADSQGREFGDQARVRAMRDLSTQAFRVNAGSSRPGETLGRIKSSNELNKLEGIYDTTKNNFKNANFSPAQADSAAMISTLSKGAIDNRTIVELLNADDAQFLGLVNQFTDSEAAMISNVFEINGIVSEGVGNPTKAPVAELEQPGFLQSALVGAGNAAVPGAGSIIGGF